MKNEGNYAKVAWNRYLSQGPLKKWTEHSQELHLLKIHSRGAPIHGLLNRWTSQLDLGSTTGGLERVVSVHNST